MSVDVTAGELPVGSDAAYPPWAWRLVIRVFVGYVRMLFRWRTRATVHGNVVPAGEAAVLVANHTSNVDPFLVGYTAWRATGHWIQPLAKAELFELPVLGFLGPRAGAIPVARETPGGRGDAYASAVARLHAGGTIYIAPEGTITHDGRLLPLRHGAARLAIEAGVPIIVVTSFGGQRGHSPVVGRPQLGVLFDVAIEQVDLEPDEDAASLTGRIAATMIDRSAELQAAYPQADTDAVWWPPYSQPAEPSRTGRESLEQYREIMAESVARARERMAEIRTEREVDDRLRDARERASSAAVRARDRAQDLADQIRARADELIAATGSGELGESLRQRAEEIGVRADELAAHAREFSEQLRASDPADDDPTSDDPVSDDPVSDDPAATTDADTDGEAEAAGPGAHVTER